jgi:AhpD family alkylhydroperoxidase
MHVTSTDVSRDLMKLGGQLPATMKAFGGLHQQAMADGALSSATKELMALAVSIAEGCSGCIAYHSAAAVRNGANREQLLETIGVAVLMGGGPASVYGAEALKHVDEVAPAAAA